MSYKYKVYGLNIESDIKIEELIEINQIDETNKVIIKHMEISKDIKDKISNNINISFSKDIIWFNINDVGIFEIADGKRIGYETYDECNETLLKIYLTCSCLGYVMIQRNILAIHGSVISNGKEAVILTGDRGAGKSTLTTAMRSRGYKFLSDDIASIYFDKKPFVNYGFPYQKLCSDAVEFFKYEKIIFKSYKSGHKIKYTIPVYSDFLMKSMPLCAICELSVEDTNIVLIEELTGVKKLNAIIKNVYRITAISEIDEFKSKYMNQFIYLSKHIKYYKIIRPIGIFSIDEEIKLIENKFFRRDRDYYEA